MCEFASLVVTKNKVYYLKDSESHEEIIRRHELKDSDSTGTRIYLVRVEVRPPECGYFFDLSNWRYKTDQDRLPRWYNEDEFKPMVMKALREKLAGYFLMKPLYDKYWKMITSDKLFRNDLKFSKNVKLMSEKSYFSKYGRDINTKGQLYRAAFDEYDQFDGRPNHLTDSLYSYLGREYCPDDSLYSIPRALGAEMKGNLSKEVKTYLKDKVTAARMKFYSMFDDGKTLYILNKKTDIRHNAS